MGVMSYGTEDYRFDDRFLAHLQTVIGIQLRRRESFILGWTDASTGLRQSVWVDTGIPIRFSFHDDGNHVLNRQWVSELIDGSRRPAGLVLGEEPTDIPADDAPHAHAKSETAARAPRPASAPYVRTSAVYSV